MMISGKLLSVLCLFCLGCWLAVGGAYTVSSARHEAAAAIVGPGDGLIGLPPGDGAVEPVKVSPGGVARGRFLVFNHLACPVRLEFRGQSSAVGLRIDPLVLPPGARRWVEVVVSAPETASPGALRVRVTGDASWPGGCARVEFSLPVRVAGRQTVG